MFICCGPLPHKGSGVSKITLSSDDTQPVDILAVPTFATVVGAEPCLKLSSEKQRELYQRKAGTENLPSSGLPEAFTDDEARVWLNSTIRKLRNMLGCIYF